MTDPVSTERLEEMLRSIGPAQVMLPEFGNAGTMRSILTELLASRQAPEGDELEVVAWRYCRHNLNGEAMPWKYAAGEPDLNGYEVEPLVTLSQANGALSAERARVEELTRARDEAHKIARNLTKALVGLTPGGSEYFTRCDILDDYFADADRCTRVVRERFESGHQAKIERTDERRRADALQAEVERLREALGNMRCPRPCNHRPDDFDAKDCVAAGECGCGAHVLDAALTKEGVNGE